MNSSSHRGMFLVSALLCLAATARGGARLDFDFVLAGDMSRYIVVDGIQQPLGPGLRGDGRGGAGRLPGLARGPEPGRHQSREHRLRHGRGRDRSRLPFFPGVGVHELDAINLPTLQWIRGFDKGGSGFPVNPGPAGSETTTYSWDHGHAHFVMLNGSCSTVRVNAVPRGQLEHRAGRVARGPT